MFHPLPALRVLLITLLMAGFSLSTSANCVWKGRNIGGDNYGASLRLGNINMTNNYIQPTGSLLATSLISLVPAQYWSDPEAVIYECDLADSDSIFEVFATNGDSNVGGWTNLGDNYFQTYFPYTGLKLIHMDSGQEFTRIWKQVALKKYDIVGNKIQIKGKHFSQIRAELIKTDNIDSTAGPSTWGCAGPAAPTWSGAYNCNQPNGYVVFKGPGMPVPEAGLDAASNFQTWGSGRYMAFGMNTSPVATLTRKNTCAVRNVTPYVLLPTISVSDLNSGGSSRAAFNVEVECQDGTVSGISSGQTSIGIQTSLPAYIQAQKLGLVNAAGGVSYLLSDNYGNSNIASGVGIRLEDSSGSTLNFVGWSGCQDNCTSAVNAGWYPVLSNASATGSAASGYTSYVRDYMAILEKLPGQTPVAGRVEATAYVLVKVQ